MDEMRIRTLEDIRQFLAGVGDTGLVLQGTKDEGYRWMQRTLIRFHYMSLGKIRRGLLLRYIERLTGYSRQQVSRLVGQFRKTGDIRRRQRTSKGFGTKYTRADIILLAAMDRAVDDASGTMVKTLCWRMFNMYGDERFERIASISVSHLYNLRKGKVYQRCRRKFTKTKAVRVNIGERCKPQAGGEPGHLRVDSVHQGDMDGKKGVYHINAVDEVTQFEIVVTVERISEKFMLAALRSLIEQFPFLIKGFHADNGSEYINHKVAKLLRGQLIRLTKSRPRHSNDNALAESKNNAIVRKNFGYIHIAKKHAELIDEFNKEFLNPCINYHRPCHFPIVETDAKGKQRKRYRQADMMTPYDKLLSLPNARSYLKAGITFEELNLKVRNQTDVQAWKQMQEARARLFDTIFRQAPRAA